MTTHTIHFTVTEAGEGMTEVHYGADLSALPVHVLTAAVAMLEKFIPPEVRDILRPAPKPLPAPRE